MMAKSAQQDVRPGRSWPLGATVNDEGVNFSLYSSGVTVELLFFDDVADARPSRVIRLDSRQNRTYRYWHACVPNVKTGQLYGYRVFGPYDPHHGRRFDGRKLLLDPYARAIAVPPNYSRIAACRPGDNAGVAMKNVVVEPKLYDWEGDMPLNRPYEETIIYEMHVRGFTRHPSSGLAPDLRGTYAGLIEKIPYLKSLGVTAVELLPVFQFDTQDAPKGLTNYWGYSPISFFAPHAAYSSHRDALGAVDEFRDMVKALHRAGLEVILDVVFNHTAEGDHTGPTSCFRGLANDVYYILETDRFHYANFSGTGNTLNTSNSVVRRMIVDSLRYWVQEMHVDGFRFDLASILARDEAGQPLENPPTIWSIETDPYLAGTKLIAEPWDAAGLYQVGSFVGDRWKEWNGRFRDDVRRFVKSDPGAVRLLPDRFLASPDIYGDSAREPEQSINFVTCHDGFTLNDLVTYNRKHNDANGEQNRDGHNENLSWNCGVEGPSDDPAIEALRMRQIKNLLTITLLSLGVPMLLMGDEVRRTQKGNNNAYCQDSELSWFDWTLTEKHADLLRFTRMLIRLRRFLDPFVGTDSMNLIDLLHHAQIEWHGAKLATPDWSDSSYSIAMTVRGLYRDRLLHLIFNAHWDPVVFELPPVTQLVGDHWYVLIDTYRNMPEAFADWSDVPPVTESIYRVAPRSVVVLTAQDPDDPVTSAFARVQHSESFDPE